MVTVSLYARVSSGRQAQEDTIASQVAALEKQIGMDGYKLLREYKFIDNGYSVGGVPSSPPKNNIKEAYSSQHTASIVKQPNQYNRMH